jgi:hypothetical protein
LVVPTWTPHPADDEFADAYGRAWTEDPELLCAFFADDGIYADAAMGGTSTGREGTVEPIPGRRRPV